MIGMLLAASTLAAAPANTDARQAYAQRLFLLEADARCSLLSARERAALEGSALQARAALVRAGLRPGAIGAPAQEAAATAACDDESLAAQTARVRDAFAHWAGRIREDFPGDERIWSASRVSTIDSMAWTLWQDLGDGYRIGRVEDEVSAAVVIAIPSPRSAVQAQMATLEFRDQAKWRDFIDPTLGGLFPASSGDTLARRAAPSALSRRIWSGGGAEEEIFPPEPAGDWLYWTLPQSTLGDLATLDPREAARLSIEFTDGRTQTLFVEIGDLAGALAFLAAGDTPSTRETVTN